jgi:hypothetical protein
MLFPGIYMYSLEKHYSVTAVAFFWRSDSVKRLSTYAGRREEGISALLKCVGSLENVNVLRHEDIRRSGDTVSHKLEIWHRRG